MGVYPVRRCKCGDEHECQLKDARATGKVSARSAGGSMDASWVMRVEAAKLATAVVETWKPQPGLHWMTVWIEMYRALLGVLQGEEPEVAFGMRPGEKEDAASVR